MGRNSSNQRSVLSGVMLYGGRLLSFIVKSHQIVRERLVGTWSVSVYFIRSCRTNSMLHLDIWKPSSVYTLFSFTSLIWNLKCILPDLFLLGNPACFVKFRFQPSIPMNHYTEGSVLSQITYVGSSSYF